MKYESHICNNLEINLPYGNTSAVWCDFMQERLDLWMVRVQLMAKATSVEITICKWLFHWYITPASIILQFYCCAYSTFNNTHTHSCEIWMAFYFCVLDIYIFHWQSLFHLILFYLVLSSRYKIYSILSSLILCIYLFFKLFWQNSLICFILWFMIK